MRKTKQTSLPNKKKNRVATNARKVTTMTINFNRGTIELTSTEMKSAMIYGSDTYKDLQAARRDYPTFKTVEIKAKRNNNDFSDLTLKAISAYVELRGTEAQKEHFAFISKRTIDEDGAYCEPQPFFIIKQWFLATFPELKAERKAYREKVQAILDEAKAKVAA